VGHFPIKGIRYTCHVFRFDLRADILIYSFAFDFHQPARCVDEKIKIANFFEVSENDPKIRESLAPLVCNIKRLGFIRNATLCARDESRGRRAPLSCVRSGEASRGETGHVHGLKFKSLASVHGHQPDRIHMQGRGWHLAQVALLGEQHKLPDAVEGSLNRHAKSNRTVFA
jgi:hypothetical protein